MCYGVCLGDRVQDGGTEPVRQETTAAPVKQPS